MILIEQKSDKIDGLEVEYDLIVFVSENGEKESGQKKDKDEVLEGDEDGGVVFGESVG